MKKLLLIALTCIGFIALIGCASGSGSTTAQPAPAPAPAPVSGPLVNAVAGTPKASDGTMDPVFANAPVIETKMQAMGDAKTANAKARVAWDAKFLYVYIEVTDPILSDKSGNAWEQDSIEVYIDENNAKSGSYTSGIAQYRVNFKNVVSGGTGADTSKFKSGVKVVTGGYNVTVAIPFLKTTPKAGSTIGFDFQTNDDGAGTGARSGVKDWANATNNNYQDASGFGNAKLQ
jgi:endo-1,4-beta-xylanase